MLAKHLHKAESAQPRGRTIVYARVFEERCLRHRELDWTRHPVSGAV